MKKIAIYLSLCIIWCMSACNMDNDIKSLVRLWTGKKIEIPSQCVFVVNAVDTVVLDNKHIFSVVNYIDSIGCIRCKSQLPEWKNFIDEILPMFGDKVSVMIFMHPHLLMDAKYAIQKDTFPYPICIDLNDELNKLNHFPDDDRFRCFLLDENNRVVLIGNPVHNPKIKDLYIRTICERLGKPNLQEATNSPRINLGILSLNESKTVKFEIKNTDQETLQIDTVFTSCDCTTAEIDKTRIPKNESAFLSVTYTPDAVGSFYREVYVKVNGEEETRIFAIEGKVE